MLVSMTKSSRDGTLRGGQRRQRFSRPAEHETLQVLDASRREKQKGGGFALVIMPRQIKVPGHQNMPHKGAPRLLDMLQGHSMLASGRPTILACAIQGRWRSPQGAVAGQHSHGMQQGLLVLQRCGAP